MGAAVNVLVLTPDELEAMLERAAAVMRSVVGHADEKTNAKYGTAKVIAFAAKVERVVMRPAKAAKRKART